jgi:hypothetical protein
MHGVATRVFSLALVVLGVAMVVRTVAAGGGVGAYGAIIGALFVAVGLGRLWIARRTR